MCSIGIEPGVVSGYKNYSVPGIGGLLKDMVEEPVYELPRL
jgi:hypothetical protein